LNKPAEGLRGKQNDVTEEVDVRWHAATISRKQRESSAGHRGCVIWFTGLSGSGKSTLANEVDKQLHARGHRSFILDGDNVRHGLNASPNLLETIHGQPFAKRFGLGLVEQKTAGRIFVGLGQLQNSLLRLESSRSRHLLAPIVVIVKQYEKCYQMQTLSRYMSKLH